MRREIYDEKSQNRKFGHHHVNAMRGCEVISAWKRNNFFLYVKNYFLTSLEDNNSFFIEYESI